MESALKLPRSSGAGGLHHLCRLGRAPSEFLQDSQRRSDLGQVIGSASILFTSLTGIAKASLICSPSNWCSSRIPRQVCMAGMLGGVVSVPAPQPSYGLRGFCYSDSGHLAHVRILCCRAWIRLLDFKLSILLSSLLTSQGPMGSPEPCAFAEAAALLLLPCRGPWAVLLVLGGRAQSCQTCLSSILLFHLAAAPPVT